MAGGAEGRELGGALQRATRRARRVRGARGALAADRCDVARAAARREDLPRPSARTRPRRATREPHDRIRPYARGVARPVGAAGECVMREDGVVIAAHYRWDDLPKEELRPDLHRRLISG